MYSSFSFSFLGRVARTEVRMAIEGDATAQAQDFTEVHIMRRVPRPRLLRAGLVFVFVFLRAPFANP